MRITKIEVTKLFGTFDYAIDMKLEAHVTILIAPNGFGKTKIVEMLYGLLTKNFGIFQRTPFDKYIVFFDQDEPISIERTEGGERPSIHFRHGSKNYQLKRISKDEVPLSSSMLRFLEDVAPIRQIGPRLYRDISVGDVVSAGELIERYSDRFPEEIRSRYSIPEVESIIQKIAIKPRFIRTQRLGTSSLYGEHRLHRERYDEDQGDQIAVVRYQSSLSREIERVLAVSTETSQSLDSTFPKRLINRLNSGGTPPDFTEQVRKLNILNDKRREIAELGLLNQQTEDDQIPSSSNQEISHVLAVLSEDTELKLAVFDDLFRKVKLFRDMINKRFQFKKMRIGKDQGYEFITSNGNQLSADYLSSGEQHELVLLYELLFETNAGSLVIIDEPELSLHIDWQREFLPDLRAIIDVVRFDALIATHSPDIIQAEHDLMVDLGQMVTTDE